MIKQFLNYLNIFSTKSFQLSAVCLIVLYVLVGHLVLSITVFVGVGLLSLLWHMRALMPYALLLFILYLIS